MKILFTLLPLIALATCAPTLRAENLPAPEMIHASNIARERSVARSTGYCWRSVKNALVASGAVSSYPRTVLACDAGSELAKRFGFKKLAARSPWEAPVGAVLVYSGQNIRAGHVEIRGRNDFISDYRGTRPAEFHFLGAYALLAAAKK